MPKSTFERVVALAICVSRCLALSNTHIIVPSTVKSLAGIYLDGRRSFLGKLGGAVAAVASTTVAISPVLATMDVEAPVTSTREAIDEAASLVRFGKAEEGKGMYEKALKYYTKAIEEAPDYGYGYSNRANVEILFGKVEDALRDYDTAVRVSNRPGANYEGLPDRWLFYLNRGTTRLALGRDAAKSVDDFNVAAGLRQRPEVMVVENRAQAHERLGNFYAAAADYASALSLSPRDVQPYWLRYANVLLEVGKDAEALELLKRVKAKFDGEGEVNMAYAAMLSATGDDAEALKIYRQIPPVQRQRYGDRVFLTDAVRWPPRLIEASIKLKGL